MCVLVTSLYEQSSTFDCALYPLEKDLCILLHYLFPRSSLLLMNVQFFFPSQNMISHVSWLGLHFILIYISSVYNPPPPCFMFQWRVRKEAMMGLAQIYKKYALQAEAGKEASKQISWIKDKLLHIYYQNSIDDRWVMYLLVFGGGGMQYIKNVTTSSNTVCFIRAMCDSVIGHPGVLLFCSCVYIYIYCSGVVLIETFTEFLKHWCKFWRPAVISMDSKWVVQSRRAWYSSNVFSLFACTCSVAGHPSLRTRKVYVIAFHNFRWDHVSRVRVRVHNHCSVPKSTNNSYEHLYWSFDWFPTDVLLRNEWLCAIQTS